MARGPPRPTAATAPPPRPPRPPRPRGTRSTPRSSPSTSPRAAPAPPRRREAGIAGAPAGIARPTAAPPRPRRRDRNRHARHDRRPDHGPRSTRRSSVLIWMGPSPEARAAVQTKRCRIVKCTRPRRRPRHRRRRHETPAIDGRLGARVPRGGRARPPSALGGRRRALCHASGLAGRHHDRPGVALFLGGVSGSLRLSDGGRRGDGVREKSVVDLDGRFRRRCLEARGFRRREARLLSKESRAGKGTLVASSGRAVDEGFELFAAGVDDREARKECGLRPGCVAGRTELVQRINNAATEQPLWSSSLGLYGVADAVVEDNVTGRTP